MSRYFLELYLSLTFLVYFVSLLVIFKFKKAIPPLRLVFQWLPRHWLICGIVIGFAGKILDGFFWQVTWRAFGWGMPQAHALMEYGTAANLVLRQAPIFLAAACHLWAAYLADKEEIARDRCLVRCVAIALAIYCLAEFIVSVVL